MIKRDYMERLIAQVVQALALMLRLRSAGDFESALQVVDETAARVLGPDHALLTRMEASTMVHMVGQYELERVRLYAILVAEEGDVHDAAGEAGRAAERYRRALELYGALGLAGARLHDEDGARVARLTEKVDVESIDERYRDQIARLTAGR